MTRSSRTSHFSRHSSGSCGQSVALVTVPLVLVAVNDSGLAMGDVAKKYWGFLFLFMSLANYENYNND